MGLLLMDELSRILNAGRSNPDNSARWLALASCLRDNGRDDEAAAVRMFYPVLQDNLARGETLESTLALMQRNAARLARRARRMEEEAICQPSPD
jgi:hypothetical protein